MKFGYYETTESPYRTRALYHPDLWDGVTLLESMLLGHTRVIDYSKLGRICLMTSEIVSKWNEGFAYEDHFLTGGELKTDESDKAM